jgi:hypothetical protein
MSLLFKKIPLFCLPFPVCLVWLAVFVYPAPPAYCQIPVGAWRDHLSWNTAERVVVARDKVYCSNGAGVCIYDMTSRELGKLTKVNGLSDAGITAMQYVSENNSLIAGYANGNIDIIAEKNIYNIPDVKRSGIYPDKRILDIYVSGNRAYLSCAFGIVVIDIPSRQIRDTYIIGDGGNFCEVFSLTECNGYFYAATAHGLKKADKNNPVLTDFSQWKAVENLPGGNILFRQVLSSNSALYISDLDNNIYYYEDMIWNKIPYHFATGKINRLNISGERLSVCAAGVIFVYDIHKHLLLNSVNSYAGVSVNAFDAVFDAAGVCWIADNRQGLVRYASANNISYCLINGPSSNNAAALRYKADRLLVAGGGRDENNSPLNRQGEIHTFSGNEWSSIRPQGVYDFTDIDISAGKPDRYYVSSWGEGVYVFENGVQVAHYKQGNSSLVAGFSGEVLCGGLLMDEDNRLWVSNDRNVGIFASGQWKAVAWQATASMGRFVEDNFRQIWTVQHYNGLRVFDKAAAEQGKSDGTIQFKPYNPAGSSPVSQNYRIVGAPDGMIWAGTSQGPVYYKNPGEIMNGISTGGEHPKKTGTDEPDYVYSLLGTEDVLSVAIDGAYRKWFGTKSGGVFLIAENEVKEVRHFTVDNSPLFSNKVHDIAINDKTGEVFFATEYGIVSYRSDAVSSGDDFGKIYAFPNPVRPGYDGEITITGLVREADVKITDTAGNLVYRTKTLGGQAVWNGCDRRGRRVASGVYLVFCTSSDGSKTGITKILIVR